MSRDCRLGEHFEISEHLAGVPLDHALGHEVLDEPRPVARGVPVGVDDHAGRLAVGLKSHGVVHRARIAVFVDEPQRLHLDDLVGRLHLEAHEPHGRDVGRPDLVQRPVDLQVPDPWHPVLPVRRVAVERPDVLDGRLDADLVMQVVHGRLLARAGGSRQWLGAVRAARIWAARQCLPRESILPTERKAPGLPVFEPFSEWSAAPSQGAGRRDDLDCSGVSAFALANSWKGGVAAATLLHHDAAVVRTIEEG